MSTYRMWFIALASLALATGLANAQIGVATSGGANSAFACSANSAGAPILRQEGYSELLGDIVITCTGGMAMPTGASTIPTTNITVYVFSAVSITSRQFGTPSGASEALLLVDEPGSGLTTGVVGNYGPKAPQTYCSTAQQQQDGGSACGQFVGTDPGTSGGPYQVAVSTMGGATAAANVYQGQVGDFGTYSVTFYGVPVMPPALRGVSRVYRITNLRIPTAGMAGGSSIFAVISTNGVTSLPVGSPSSAVGVVGGAMMAGVDAAPAGGLSPFSQCAAQPGAMLAAHVQFTEGFATMFKTRVAPLANTLWASTGPNTGTPGQNIPGGMYNGFASNNESGFILPAATAAVSGVSYTAGLTDFGTRLKAVFTNIPSGVQLYVSTSSTNGPAVPGGTGTAPDAVLVASVQSNDANNDGAVFTPLQPTTTGSDGRQAYPLTPDGSGTAAAIWEVVNASPGAIDNLTFSIYVSYTGIPSATTQVGAPSSNVALSFAPEPGGASFTTINSPDGLTSPVPRFMILTPQQGSWVTINACSINPASTATVPFSYTSGGTAPAGQTVGVTTTPTGLTVTATPVVTTPAQGTWLAASINGGTLTISVDPAGLAASATAYTGSVTLSATGVGNVSIPVTLTVYPPAALSVSKTHTGYFEQGQQGASYAITVSNAAGAGAFNGTVTVTEQPPSGETLATMSGTGWNCTALPTCTRSDTLAGGASYRPIVVTVNVSATAASPQVNAASISIGGPAVAYATDSTPILPAPVLNIAKRHAGNYTQGQTNAAYTVTVSNSSATSATIGTVTVIDNLPAGLTLVSMAPTSGNNWTCTGNTCSRGDSLGAGASYDTITVTVNVAPTAAPQVINQVTVSGGGSPAASASDVTNIGGVQFYPLTPCRVADTRVGAGFTGTQGPPYLTGGTSRSFAVAGNCGVPANASAYSLNVTVVPRTAALGFLTTWPTGQTQPNASTLNSPEGQVVANAALVPAGTNGNISIYASNDTDVLFDINGYFAPPAPAGLQFYPLTPCRVADTRAGAGFTGSQGPPYLASKTSRNFAVAGLCGVPSTAAAYSLNVTVVPRADALGYLTTWPTGQTQPWASTLNSPAGAVVANAAIVPAGTNGDIGIYASDATDVLFDINGYFAAAGASGLNYYAMTPCRVADTRSWAGFPGQLGPPTMAAATSRSFPVQSSACSVPSVAAAYSFNVTVVPSTGVLNYLTTWPTGQTQPWASTLNSPDGLVVANAALVPAGTSGAISIYVSDPTDVLFDIGGFFAPGQ